MLKTIKNVSRGTFRQSIYLQEIKSNWLKYKVKTITPHSFNQTYYVYNYLVEENIYRSVIVYFYN